MARDGVFATPRGRGYTKSADGGGRRSKAAVRYAENRPNGSGEREQRELYGKDGPMTRAEAYELIDRADAEFGKYHYHAFIAPGEGHSNVDMRAVTLDSMAKLEAEHRGLVAWVAVDHDTHSQHDHSHVIFVTDRTLSREMLAHMRAEIGEARDRHTRRDGLEQMQDHQHRGEEHQPAPVRDDLRQRFEEQRSRADQLVSEYRKERQAQVIEERNRYAGNIKTDADYRRWSEGTQKALSYVNASMERLKQDLHRGIDREEREAQCHPEQASTARSDAQLEHVQSIREAINTRRNAVNEMMNEYRQEARAEVSERRAQDAERIKTPQGAKWLNNQLDRDLRQVDRDTNANRSVALIALEREERQALRDVGASGQQTRERRQEISRREEGYER